MKNEILTPNYRQLDWYKRRTAFIHFTVNTFTGNEWGDGTESPEIFNPTELDCPKEQESLVAHHEQDQEGRGPSRELDGPSAPFSKVLNRVCLEVTGVQVSGHFLFWFCLL